MGFIFFKFSKLGSGTPSPNPSPSVVEENQLLEPTHFFWAGYATAWAPPTHECLGPDHTNFWESNMDPPNNVQQSNNSLSLGPYHLFNPGGPLFMPYRDLVLDIHTK